MSAILIIAAVVLNAYVLFSLNAAVARLQDRVTQLEVRESAKVGPARTHRRRPGGVWDR